MLRTALEKVKRPAVIKANPSQAFEFIAAEYLAQEEHERVRRRQ